MTFINQNNDDIGIVGYVLGFLMLTLLIVSGIISYKSIDWDVLTKLESQKLMVPVQATPSAQPQINKTNNQKK